MVTSPPISADTNAFLEREHRHFINGEWITPHSQVSFTTLDPAREVEIASLPAGNSEDIDEAVSAARSVFASGIWRTQAPSAKESIMVRIAQVLETRADMFSELEVLDNGMVMDPIAKWAPLTAARIFRYYAGWCDKISGRTLPINGSPSRSMSDVVPTIIRQPIGVAGQIIPWNYPLAMAAMKIAPALAAGCSVVMKPAELASLSTLALGDVFAEAGLPPGTINIVTGLGHEAGAALSQHMDVDKIAFTGSTQVGKEITRAATGNLKRVSLELGGKSPFIVFPDADLDVAVERAHFSSLHLSGQNCMCSSRIYLHQDIADAFTEKLVASFKNTQVGSGFENGSRIGPLISAKQLERVNSYVRGAEQQGAQILTGGNKIRREGYFYEPTIIYGANQNMTCVQEEIFGPVTTIQTFEDADEAFSKANDSVYGLVASIWTNDLSIANRGIQEIRSGTVTINHHGLLDFTVPIGGLKQSGWGRENGPDGLDLYLEDKTVAFV